MTSANTTSSSKFDVLKCKSLLLTEAEITAQDEDAQARIRKSIATQARKAARLLSDEQIADLQDYVRERIVEAKAALEATKVTTPAAAEPTTTVAAPAGTTPMDELRELLAGREAEYAELLSFAELIQDLDKLEGVVLATKAGIAEYGIDAVAAVTAEARNGRYYGARRYRTPAELRDWRAKKRQTEEAAKRAEQHAKDVAAGKENFAKTGEDYSLRFDELAVRAAFVAAWNEAGWGNDASTKAFAAAELAQKRIEIGDFVATNNTLRHDAEQAEVFTAAAYEAVEADINANWKSAGFEKTRAFREERRASRPQVEAPQPPTSEERYERRRNRERGQQRDAHRQTREFEEERQNGRHGRQSIHGKRHERAA